MPRVLLVLALLAPTLASSQTCGGGLALPFARAKTAGADTTEWSPASTFYFDAAITSAVGDAPAPEHAPLDWFLERADRYEIHSDSLQPRFSGLLFPPDTMRVWTRCGFDLLRIAITDRWEDETMILDLYNVPAHVPLAPSRPIPFRSGRFALNLSGSLQTGPGHTFDVDQIVALE